MTYTPPSKWTVFKNTLKRQPDRFLDWCIVKLGGKGVDQLLADISFSNLSSSIKGYPAEIVKQALLESLPYLKDRRGFYNEDQVRFVSNVSFTCLMKVRADLKKRMEELVEQSCKETL